MGHYHDYYSCLLCKPTRSILAPDFQEDSDIPPTCRDADHMTLVSEREGAYIAFRSPSFIHSNHPF